MRLCAVRRKSTPTTELMWTEGLQQPLCPEQTATWQNKLKKKNPSPSQVLLEKSYKFQPFRTAGQSFAYSAQRCWTTTSNPSVATRRPCSITAWPSRLLEPASAFLLKFSLPHNLNDTGRCPAVLCRGPLPSGVLLRVISWAPTKDEIDNWECHSRSWEWPLVSIAAFRQKTHCFLLCGQTGWTNYYI